ncbi:hypothetical protein N302_04725, partial [Corvus brachyrhynchos]
QALECLDLRECGDSVVEIMSRCLQSECRQRCRLALRGLVVLTKDPAMVRRRQRLKLCWGKQSHGLGWASGAWAACCPHGLEKLVLRFFPLLQDNSHVQMLSIHLFCKVMELVVDEGKKPLKTIVCQILSPLLLHCHDE